MSSRKRDPESPKTLTNPDIHHGEPCFAGTRIPVRMIAGSLADGMTVEQILEEYPQLTAEDIQQALPHIR